MATADNVAVRPPRKNIKLQFEVSENLMREIELLKEALEFSGHRDFFATSIGVMRWCAQQARLGETIGSLDSNGRFTSLNLPGFEMLRDQVLIERELEKASAVTNESQIGRKVR